MPDVLMIIDDGAYGDQGFKIPALMALRNHYDQIWVSGFSWAREALEGTGWVDGFVIKPDDFVNWKPKDQRSFLIDATRGVNVVDSMNARGCIAGRLCFHVGKDYKADWSLEKKRALNIGKNYFDEMSIHFGVPEAVGARPSTAISQNERRMLAEFRSDYDIPENAFLLGWQFTGSSLYKWYPFFKEVIQENIMRRFPHVYVVGMGDLGSHLHWSADKHDGRFINLYDLYSFREAYLLTSIFDCLVTPDTGIAVFSQCFPDTQKILLSTIIGGHYVCGDDTTVIQSTAECSPCYNLAVDCKHDGDNPWMYCMGKIRPKKIVAAIEKVIEHKRTCDISRIDPPVFSKQIPKIRKLDNESLLPGRV